MLLIICIITAAVVLIVLSGCVSLAAYVMNGKKKTADEVFKKHSKLYDISFYENAEKTDYTVKSFDGYTIHAQLLKAEKESAKYVIISHGYTNNLLGSLKYAKLYLEKGFNCIIYDLRGHGDNKKTFTTYGIREGKDIAAIVEDTRKRYDDIEVLGLHGESLGAASTVFSLKYKPQIDFAVSDCGFADIENVLKLCCKDSHLPVCSLVFADIGARIFYRHSIKAMRPIDALADNKIPILFIHGADDKFVPPENTKRMYEKANCKKRMYIAKKARHAKSILDYKTYSEEIDKFFDEVGINH